MTEGGSALPLRAVFLAAGFATRLWPLTRERAKPLLEVGGEPLLTRLVRQVAATGRVREGVVVTSGRFHPDFVAWRAGLGAGAGLELELIDDGAGSSEERLGAVADLGLALERTRFRDPVSGWIVLAGDNLLDFELAPAVERFLETGAAQLLTRRLEGPAASFKYNEVLLDGRRVRSFREKPERSRSELAAIAVYVLPPELPALVAAHLARGGPRDAPGHLIEHLVGQLPFEAAPVGGRWFDIGDRDDLEAARAALG